ncbi:type II toxin-antitoxin system RelE/ParE family toxin [Synechococcus elongatus]|uniref:type II toxin-antitoxin system RelE/ParE family toxin n=1 Tax=Synechococcus elongatus TaxID=32046 RepID=UPI000F7E64F0|nr:type II toxin-antitoxin system RelE/ParE family toxin [Synechococcus elongatus]
MRYEFHPTALQEYAEAVQFFSQSNQHQSFIDTIEKAVFQILAAPQRWPVVEGQIRRYLTSKFFYRVDSDRIIIAAVISCRRDPEAWKGRLSP